MVGIVQSIEKIFVERVDVLESRKAVEYCLKFFAEGLGGKLDFSSVEPCNSS